MEGNPIFMLDGAPTGRMIVSLENPLGGAAAGVMTNSLDKESFRHPDPLLSESKGPAKSEKLLLLGLIDF